MGMNHPISGGGGGGGGGGGAPVDAYYVVSGADATLTNEIVKPYMAFYDPDVPPAAPSAYDDEFDDDAIDAKWSFTGGADEAFDLMQNTGNPHRSETIMHGYMMLQACDMIEAFTPNITQAFTVVVKVYLGWQPATDANTTLQVQGQDANHIYQLSCGRPSTFDTNARTVYNNGGGAAQGAVSPFGGTTAYMMITHDGSKNFSAFVSSNGLAWKCIEKDRALSNFTSFVQILVQVTSPDNPDGLSVVEFVRYFTTEGQYKIGADV